MVATLHYLDFPVSKSPLGPLTARYVLETPPNGPKICARWPLTASNQDLAISWAMWRKV